MERFSQSRNAEDLTLVFKQSIVTSKRSPSVMFMRKTLYLTACLLSSCLTVFAQRVSYCEPYSDRWTVREEMAGKGGDYYWVETTSKKRPMRHGENLSEERTFTIYDRKMKLINEVGQLNPAASPLKEYL